MYIYTYKIIKTNCHKSQYMYVNLMAWDLWSTIYDQRNSKLVLNIYLTFMPL